MNKKIIILLIVLAVTVSAVAFWYYQRNVYTRADLRLEIRAPQEARLAQEIEYTVVYTNNGEFRMGDMVLTFQFPEHSIVGEGGSLRQEIRLDDLYPGESESINFTARLLGREEEHKRARASLSYRPANLDTVYESETSHLTEIVSVPLILDFVDLPSRIEAGREISFRLTYRSNVNYPLSDLGLNLELPDDFELRSASPQPLEEPYWDIGLLNRNDEGSVMITGEIDGEVGEEKEFIAQLGLWRDDRFVILEEFTHRVKIVVPSLYITQEINGNPKYVASPGDSLHYEISFKNIGRESLRDLKLEVELEGKAFDFNNVKVLSGNFFPGRQVIIFNRDEIPELRFLEPHEEGTVEFLIDLGPQEKNALLKNRVSLGAAISEFEIKIDSDLDLQQKVEYRTITWNLKNHYNDVKSIKVRAVLADDLSLTGEILPDDAVLTFDSFSREVIWSIEELAAGQEKSVSFGISERSEMPFEIIQISGEDQWTERTIEKTLELEPEDDYEG